MTLEEKKSMARKSNVIPHLGDIQAKLVQFSVSGFHMESELPLDNVMKAIKALDDAIDQFVEEIGRVKEPITAEPGADVETSAPLLN